jgi:uncharacterized protein
MKIAVIGATGFVGKHIVNELAGRNYKVLGISRSMELETEEIEFIAQDIFNTAELSEKLKNYDVVVSAYNPGWSKNPTMYDEFIKGSQSIQQATKLAEVKRLIIIGGAGSLYLPDGSQLVDSDNFPADIKNGAAAARDYLNIIQKETDIDWVYFSPPKEMHPGIKTGRTRNYRLGTDFLMTNAEGRSVLSVEDVAVVIADEIEIPKYYQMRFTAAY